MLVLGGGPAALCIASELVQRGVAVAGIAPDPIESAWPNTYGIWVRELENLGLDHLLQHRWSDTVSQFGSGGSSDQDQAIFHGTDYGLFDRKALQQHWLQRCDGMTWHRERVRSLDAGIDLTTVTCASGLQSSRTV